MKKNYLILILTVFFSCNNKSNNEISSHVDSVDVVKELINPELREDVKLFSELPEIERMPHISIEKSCFVLASWIDENNFDSIVSLTFNSCRTGTPDAYKGALCVDGYNVAIFDYFNFLTPYYNSDSLRQIPYESFECYPLNYIVESRFYIRNGVLMNKKK